MDLIEVLQRQIIRCKEISGHHCGVIVSSSRHMDIVKDILSNIIERPNRDIRFYDGLVPEVRWRNGSVLSIVIPKDNVRGMRFCNLIVDNDIDNNILRKYIFSTSIPCSYVNISIDDLNKSKQYNQVCSLITNTLSFTNVELSKKEYECMWINNEYDNPVVEKEVNNDKVLLYEAWGIPKDMITYATEFVNKTKQTYLNIKGEFKNEIIGFENDINVHLRIDTDIYDGYEVHIEDGLVTVVLHEIKNEAPILKDYGVI